MPKTPDTWTLVTINNGELDWEVIEGREDLDAKLAKIADPDKVYLHEGVRTPFAKVTRIELGAMEPKKRAPRSDKGRPRKVANTPIIPPDLVAKGLNGGGAA